MSYKNILIKYFLNSYIESWNYEIVRLMSASQEFHFPLDAYELQLLSRAVPERVNRNILLSTKSPVTIIFINSKTLIEVLQSTD